MCLSVDRRVGGKPRTGARGGVPAEGASTPSLARRAPTKPGVWPMGVPRSGSQAGVTGSSWVSAASLLPLQTPASRLGFGADFQPPLEDVCASEALIFL